VAMIVQNYFFSIAAAAKLVERIHSLTFEKVVHQEIHSLTFGRAQEEMSRAGKTRCSVGACEWCRIWFLYSGSVMQ